MNITLSSAVLRAFDECKYFSMKLHILLIPVMWVSLWVGIRAAGLVGAMAAFALVQTIDVAITTAKAGQILGLKLKDLRYLTPLARTFAAAALASLAAISIKQLLPDVRGTVVLLVCLAAFGGVYLIAAFIVGAVTDAEKSDLRTALLRFNRREGLSDCGAYKNGGLFMTQMKTPVKATTDDKGGPEVSVIIPVYQCAHYLRIGPGLGLCSDIHELRGDSRQRRLR